LKWQLGDELDERIINYDGWLDFVDIEVPDEPGVFVLVSEDLNVLYIGYGKKSLAEEIKAAISKEIAFGASMFAWFITNTLNNADNLKAFWVKKYQPANNDLTEHTINF